jgi:riboflavin biosynthesis pyrimidine reductase
MPEQLTKHPEVTIHVLRSAGAKCIAEPEGPSFISSTVARRRVDRRYS